MATSQGDRDTPSQQNEGRGQDFPSKAAVTAAGAEAAISACNNLDFSTANEQLSPEQCGNCPNAANSTRNQELVQGGPISGPGQSSEKISSSSTASQSHKVQRNHEKRSLKSLVNRILSREHSRRREAKKKEDTDISDHHCSNKSDPKRSKEKDKQSKNATSANKKDKNDSKVLNSKDKQCTGEPSANQADKQKYIEITCYSQLTPFYERRMRGRGGVKGDALWTPPLAIFSSDEDISSLPGTPQLPRLSPTEDQPRPKAGRCPPSSKSCGHLGTLTIDMSSSEQAKSDVAPMTDSLFASIMAAAALDGNTMTCDVGSDTTLVCKSSDSSVTSLPSETAQQAGNKKEAIYMRQHSLPTLLGGEHSERSQQSRTPPLGRAHRYPRSGLRQQYSCSAVLSRAMQKRSKEGNTCKHALTSSDGNISTASTESQEQQCELGEGALDRDRRTQKLTMDMQNQKVVVNAQSSKLDMNSQSCKPDMDSQKRAPMESLILKQQAVSYIQTVGYSPENIRNNIHKNTSNNSNTSSQDKNVPKTSIDTQNMLASVTDGYLSLNFTPSSIYGSCLQQSLQTKPVEAKQNKCIEIGSCFGPKTCPDTKPLIDADVSNLNCTASNSSSNQRQNTENSSHYVTTSFNCKTNTPISCEQKRTAILLPVVHETSISTDAKSQPLCDRSNKSKIPVKKTKPHWEHSNKKKITSNPGLKQNGNSTNATLNPDQSSQQKSIAASKSSPQLSDDRRFSIPVQHICREGTLGDNRGGMRRSQSYSPVGRAFSRTISKELERELHRTLIETPKAVPRRLPRSRRSSVAFPLTSRLCENQSTHSSTSRVPVHTGHEPLSCTQTPDRRLARSYTSATLSRSPLKGIRLSNIEKSPSADFATGSSQAIRSPRHHEKSKSDHTIHPMLRSSEISIPHKKEGVCDEIGDTRATYSNINVIPENSCTNSQPVYFPQHKEISKCRQVSIPINVIHTTTDDPPQSDLNTGLKDNMVKKSHTYHSISFRPNAGNLSRPYGSCYHFPRSTRQMFFQSFTKEPLPTIIAANGDESETELQSKVKGEVEGWNSGESKLAMTDLKTDQAPEKTSRLLKRRERPRPKSDILCVPNLLALQEASGNAPTESKRKARSRKQRPHSDLGIPHSGHSAPLKTRPRNERAHFGRFIEAQQKYQHKRRLSTPQALKSRPAARFPVPASMNCRPGAGRPGEGDERASGCRPHSLSSPGLPLAPPCPPPPTVAPVKPVTNGLSTPQPLKSRPATRSPVPASTNSRPGARRAGEGEGEEGASESDLRWALLARMKRCKSEPTLPSASRGKRHCAFLNATSAHAGDIVIQPLTPTVREPQDDDDSTSEDTNSLRSDSIADEQCTVSGASFRRRPLIGCQQSARCHSGFNDETEEEEEAPTTVAEALWDHVTLDPEELAFRVGDLIKVLDAGEKDWWFGELAHGQTPAQGWFPSAFVRLHVNQEDTAEELLLSQQTGPAPLDCDVTLKRQSLLPAPSRHQARLNVVTEILGAERDYVKLLQDVVEGYIEKARRRPEMFSTERLRVIFSNLEQIYEFAASFHSDLEKHVTQQEPHMSCIGACFSKHTREFEIYSEYCNNHPAALEELRVLQKQKKYQHFFEACRLLQQMIEIPLQGFLLTPVQKICKYPLQLRELLRYTEPSHPDYSELGTALEDMKRIALLINERKRKLESIDRLAHWQSSIGDWEGPDLIEESSELVHSGDLYKVNSAGWQQERAFFLFDHQLVYCKKDLLWRDVLLYRGRVHLDQAQVVSLPDGKDSTSNTVVRNGFRIVDSVRDKSFLLMCRTAQDKQSWLQALHSERDIVEQDRLNGFDVTVYRQNVQQMYRKSIKKGKKSHRSPSGKDPFDDDLPAPTLTSTPPMTLNPDKGPLAAVRSPQRKPSTKEALQYAHSQNKRSGFIPFLRRKIKQ